MIVIALVIAAMTVIYIGGLIAGSTRGRFAYRSRLAAAIAVANALLMVLASRVLIPWFGFSWLWLIVVAAFAVGTAGVVLRWGSLPVLLEGRRARGQWISSIVQIVVVVALGAAVSQ